MEWFKKHRKYLVAESNSLSNNSNYKELFQFRNKLFVSQGNIVVRLNETHFFPILIVYPNSTPFQLPLIFPLKNCISKEDVEELSKFQLQELVEKINPLIRYYYELRHQNASGDLCILERDDLDSGNKFYGITTILQRVRDWFAAHFTNQFPPESMETEFVAHFKNINKEIRIIYPEHFLNEDLVEGDCYFQLFKHIPKINIFKNDKYLYSGVFMDGLKKNGLIYDMDFNLAGRFSDTRFISSRDLYKMPDLVNELIREKEILKSVWFHVSSEFNPFMDFKELIKIIGEGKYENGVSRIERRLNELNNILPVSFFIGIRFPNRKGVLEFQFFNVYQRTTNNDPLLFNPDGVVNFEDKLNRYEFVEAIVGEKITEETYHQRNGNRAVFTQLRHSKINVAGVGSLGSEIADCIGKAGVGRVLLLDNQVLNSHNPVRHLSGIEYSGELKVLAVGESIRNHNPFIQVGSYPINLFEADLYPQLENDSITISSIADDNVEGFINQQLVFYNKSAFYIRALRGGKVARIFRVIPGKDACFHCLNIYRNEKKEFIEIPEDENLPTLRNECNNPIRPASAADLKLISAMASRLVIDHIQNGDSIKNHWIWSTELLDCLPIAEPFQIYSQNIPPHPKCFYCNHDKEVQVSISEDTVLFMQSLIAENPKIETGGVLAGSIDEKGNMIIHSASSPGPKAKRTEVSFEKDIQFCQQFLDDLYEKSNGKIIYVGEWHSHPSTNNNPSGMDIQSLSEIATQENYLTEHPLMIIFSNTGEPSTTVHPAGRRYYHSDLKIQEGSESMIEVNKKSNVLNIAQ